MICAACSGCSCLTMLAQTCRATGQCREVETGSSDKTAEMRANVVSELCKTYNNCRRMSQQAGRRVSPQKWVVSSEFFIAERHADWHADFQAGRVFLETRFFHSDPRLMQVNRLMQTTCSSLSFFRYMEKTAFPIDQELFHQIQNGELIFLQRKVDRRQAIS